ncbi:glycosyltransferase family 4 protein [Microbacterium sp. Marseille-Q6648]|uniref:glycosyltransferase family 4 protein n=1 Tax=Microbacterium sp. Marseille-Q6648 TaxID=2937991 RepID=UPI00203CE15B|nr:glycosyltransferase family 4 protein [Microbacterium sp. Marseille-Q6648]
MSDAPVRGMLRVVHLDHTSVPGGAEFALLRLLQADPEWKPLLLLPPSAAGGVYADLAGRVPVRIAGVAQRAGVSAGGVGAAALAAGRLLVQAAVTRLDPAFRTADVVNANTARAAAYGALAAVTSRVPFVVHLRDLVTPEALGGFGFSVMSRLALPRADGVIANSRATLDSARPFLRADAATVVIPSASGLRPADPASDRRPGDTTVRAAGPLRIGMLARIDPWKGQSLLLEAFARAHGDTDAVLEFAGAALFGHADHLDRLRERAEELGVADRVVFHGHVEQPAEVLRRWDVAVQYSTRPEPLGQNVLQYLAAGRTTVVAGEGGPAEWVEHERNGLVVPPRDVPALSAALHRLAEDDALRARLARNALTTPGLLSDAEVAAAHAAFFRTVRDRAGHAGARRERVAVDRRR